jgi:hypothetical protein
MPGGFIMVLTLFNSDELFVLSQLICKNYFLSLSDVNRLVNDTIESCGDPMLKDIYVGLRSCLGAISHHKWIGLVPLVISLAPFDQDDLSEDYQAS